MENVRLSRLRSLTIPGSDVLTRNTNKIKSWLPIVPIVLTTSAILKLPIFPWMISLLGDFIFAATYMFYSTIIWNYYESLHMSKKTVLTYLIQDLMMIFISFRSILTIKLWLLSAGTFDNVLINNEYPNLISSLLSSAWLPAFGLQLVSIGFSFQAFAKLNPAAYLSFNHERARNTAIRLLVFIFIAELIIVSTVYGTLCSKADIALLQALTGLKLNLKSTPVLSAWNICVAALPFLVIWFTKRKQGSIASKIQINQPRIFLPPQVAISIISGRITDEPRSDDNPAFEMSLTECLATIRPLTLNTVESTMATETRSSIWTISRFPVRNTVAPKEFVTPLGKTHMPFIPDHKVFLAGFLVFITAFFIIVFLSSTDRWWVSFYIKDILLLMLLFYWVHTSEEISGYARRKLFQYLESCQSF